MFNSIKVALGLLAIGAGFVNVAAKTDVLADFTGADWIWTPASTGGNYPVGNATFRRDYYPAAGKTPLSANILITTDNAYTLFVNGQMVGLGTDYLQAQRYCVPLVPDCNVFAIEGQNTATVPNPAGALAAIQVRYTDGFTETIVTDTEWHGVTGAPAGFEQVAFDDSNWPAAFNQGPWPTTAPWSNTIAIPPATSDPGPNLLAANWIWTNEVSAGVAPIGTRAFRKTVTLPAGQVADTITIDIAVDNAYTLYINGLVVGSGGDWTTAQRFQVNFVPSNTVTIAVVGDNVGGPAGLLAAGVITGCVCGCGSDTTFITDSSWKFSTTVPAGFIAPGFDDSAWPAAIVEGANGVGPWGPIATPTSNSPQSGPISGAPSAPPASVVA
ncbi:lectin [Pholiota molesta]|nr:lectin [Pholiota molesta]